MGFSNDIVMPVFLRRRLGTRGSLQEDMAGTLLNIRRTAIFVVLFLGYGYYRAADISAGLASLGLLSFAAIAQMAPALLGGLVWRQAQCPRRDRGDGQRLSRLGLSSFSCRASAGPDNSHIASTVLSFLLPFTDLFSGAQSDPLVNATALSMLVNVAPISWVR